MWKCLCKAVSGSNEHPRCGTHCTSSLSGVHLVDSKVNLHGHKPDVSHLRVWGCTAYVHLQKDQRSPLGPHYDKCVFIGYPEGYKAWKFYNLSTKRTLISERADFDERHFLARPSTLPSPPLATSSSSSSYVPPVVSDDEDSPGSVTGGGQPAIPQLPAPAPAPAQPATPPPPPPALLPDPAPAPAPPGGLPNGSPIGIGARLPARRRNPPGQWWKLGPAQLHAD